MGSVLRLVLVSANIILALLVFQNGFLLKRQEISAKSSCADAHAEPGMNCWMEQQYERVIIILVDALRYDFLQPMGKKSSEIPSEEWYFRGQMKQVGELVTSGRASIGTLLADPPTTTLQRLKALTTGTLPTFIDAGDNFSPDAAVNEDSFVHQASVIGKNVTLLGDDTWLSLYPNAFSKTAAYDSFDINDLNTVDDKIAPILREEIASPNSSSIIIAHFLGVDHCGHKFGPTHPVMADTLRKMDKIIAQAANSMRKDDLLVVIGDHGMTATGDHGGESDLEVRAGILVHSKKHQISLPSRPIHQIDIVPTVSLLMGLPIPFSNLGTVIVEMFNRNLWETAVAMNYEQIKRFAETYATQKNFGELHTHTARDSNSMEEQIDTMSRIQTTLRVAWTQFDDAYINVGIFSLVEAITFLMTNEQFSLEWIIFRTGCGLLQSALLTDKTDSDGSARTLLLMALCVSCISSLFVFAQKAVQCRFSMDNLISSRTLGPLFVLIHAISLFSNSFVIYEGKVIRFLLQSLIVLVFLEKVRDAPKPRKSFKFTAVLKFLNHDWNLAILTASLALLRLEPLFHKCREEEVECEMYYPVRLGASLSADARIVRLIIALITLGVTNYLMFKIVISKYRSTGFIRTLSALSWLLIVIIGYHLMLVAMNNSERAIFSAQVVFFLSIGFAIVALKQNALLCAHFAVMPIYILFGDGLIPALAAFMILSTLITNFFPKATLPSAIALLAPFGFYFLGHSPVISSIPWHAAFVGIPGGAALRTLPAIFVLTHLNFSAISSAFLIVDEQFYYYTESLILMALRATFSCIAASNHRRHLMVWKIFAPKFIFECILAIFFIFTVNAVCVFRKFMGRNGTEREKAQ